MTQENTFADELFASVKGYLARSLAPLTKRLEALEARPVVNGKDGRDGLNGKDAPPVEILPIVDQVLKLIPPPTFDAAMVELMVRRAVDAIPRAKDGAPGKDADASVIAADVFDRVSKMIPTPKDGKDVDPSLIALMIEAQVSKAVAAIPAPKDGRDGKDAEPVNVAAVVADVLRQVPVPKNGRDGTDGKDALPVDPADVAERVAKMIPLPKDGRDAEPVNVDAVIEAVVKRIPVPRDGRDGKDAAEVDLDAMATKVLALVPVPRDGRDGKDGAKGGDGMAGRDGFTVDDFSIKLADDGRTVIASMRAGDRVIEKRLQLAGLPLYRGVVKSGQTGFKAGDAHTWGGSLWIAKRDTDSAPPGDDWQMCVKGAK